MRTIIKIAVLFVSMAVMSIFSVAVSAEIYLDDSADLYTDSEETYISDLMTEASEHTGWNYGIVTMNEDFTYESQARTRAESIYDSVFGRDSSGVLFMCDVGYRYIVIAGDARRYVGGSRFENMLEKIKEHYFNFEDISCATTFIGYTQKYYDRGPGSFDLNTGALIIGIVTGLIAAVISIAAVMNSYEKHCKPITNNYLDKRTLDIYRKTDTFVTQTTVRQSHSSGGGGGGGHHGGGGFGGHR